MKKPIKPVFVVVSALLLISFCSCSLKITSGADNRETSSEASYSTEAPVSGASSGITPTGTSEQGSETAVPSSAPDLSSPVSEPSTTDLSSYGPNVIGFTSKGYKIVNEDGLTYINGVLVVNKTYSVPSSYGPGDLTDECREAFNTLVSAAAEDGLNIFVVSGYRSYSTQEGLYQRYCSRDGQERADTYSARPGHSEHQTGLAIDVNSVSYSFADTAEGQWIAANSYKYGFIVRYGRDKESVTGYAYEPWHIRYVGVAMAQAIYDSGLSLEEYLGISSIYA
ncbi:MAG: M15 family metallopeptidase [Clostridia bacterium]|nr:M15 family metallopeptidase [Clostridia bacterium]